MGFSCKFSLKPIHWYMRLTVAITTMAISGPDTFSPPRTPPGTVRRRAGAALPGSQRSSATKEVYQYLQYIISYHIISIYKYIHICIHIYIYIYICVYICVYIYIYISIYPWYMDVYGVSAWKYHQTQYNSTIMILSGMPHMFSWDLLRARCLRISTRSWFLHALI